MENEKKRLEKEAKEKLRLAHEADIKAWGNNIVEFHPEDRHKFELIIKGENNVIKLGKLGNFASSKCKLHVYGNHNELTLGNNVRGRDLYIRIGEPYPTPKPTHHGKIRIGNNLSVVSTCIHLLHSHSSIIIGDNCMFSFGIQIRNTDGHPIYEKGSRIPINHVQDLVIGDHVWIGHSVSMTKSAQIAHDCVVGCNSVICKKYEEPYCAIAGNPAKIVRRNIEWESNQTADFLENGQNIDSE